jgi:hypothetical protein
MYNLILKDVLVQKKTVLLGIAYILLMIIAFQSMGQDSEIVMFAAGVVALTYILTLSACAYDEKCKSDIMLNSLPVRKNTIVMSRYLSAYLFAAIGVLYYFVASTAINMSGLPLKASPVTLQGLLGALFAVTMICSIYLPVFYKFGYIKSKIINLIVFFSIFFSIGALSYVAKENLTNPFVKAIVDFAVNQSDSNIVLFIIAFMLLILFVSYNIALKLYRSREF